MFKVYKITGAHTNNTYYGYAEHDPLETFMAGALRDGDRGDARWFWRNQKNTPVVSLISEHTEEVDAFIARNDARMNDPMSITGPSVFPMVLTNRADKTKQNKWLSFRSLASCKTAREAYSKGAYGYDVVTSLSKKYSREAIVEDLLLPPLDFCNKYNVPLHNE